MKHASRLLTLLLWLSASIAAQGIDASPAPKYDAAALKAMFAHIERPVYPFDARRAHLTGSGLFHIDFSTDGAAMAVRTLKSTGHAQLDSETLRALRLWRARPSCPRHVDMPIAYTMNGIQAAPGSASESMRELQRLQSGVR